MGLVGSVMGLVGSSHEFKVSLYAHEMVWGGEGGEKKAHGKKHELWDANAENDSKRSTRRTKKH